MIPKSAAGCGRCRTFDAATRCGLFRTLIRVWWIGRDRTGRRTRSLLYHIAKVELGWLYGDLKGLTDLTPAVKPDFPFPSTESDRTHLTRVLGIPLAEHVARLEHSRDVFLQEFQGISSDEWRRLRRPPDFAKVRDEVTPEWAVFHLVEHETGHAFQISSLKARGTRMLAAQNTQA